MSEFEGLQAAEEAKPKNPFELIGDSGDVEYEVETPEVTDSVAEPEEGSPVPEVEDGATPQQPVVKKMYTPEELQEIISSDGEVDVTRLTPEGQATMKAMQRAFTPKLQEAAEIRKELERIRQDIEAAKPKAQPKDIYEAYDQDPEGVSQYVDGEITRLIREDAAANAGQIEQLRNLKDQFRDRELNKLRTQSTQSRQIAEVVADIQRTVPDIATKQNALAKFALEVMGYTPEELAAATDPAVAGRQAVQVISRINQTYDRFMAGKTVAQKQVRPKPTAVESPGRGFESKQINPIDTLKKKAIETGNFRDYFLALEDEE